MSKLKRPKPHDMIQNFRTLTKSCLSLLQLPGNKMDSHNLATLFGPNILHKAKVGSEKSFVVEDMDRAEERSEVIAVLEDMIDFHEHLFNVSVHKGLRKEIPNNSDIL